MLDKDAIDEAGMGGVVGGGERGPPPPAETETVKEGNVFTRLWQRIVNLFKF